MSNYELIKFEVVDGVATITINRPEVANAFNSHVGREIFEASLECSSNSDIRAVVLTGAGKFFCAGGDLAEFAQTENLDALLKQMTTHLHGAISRFARMNAPLIGAINGTAGGGGFSLMCACDIIYLADTAKLTMAYTAAGLTPDASSTYFLPRMIGSQRALEMALTNRRLTAAEALAWGLVNYVVPAEDVLSEAQKLASQLAAGPTLAYGATKKLMRNSFTESLESQMEDEAQSIVAMTYTADAQEGIDAFLNKRKPAFKGQ